MLAVREVEAIQENISVNCGLISDSTEEDHVQREDRTRSTGCQKETTGPKKDELGCSNAVGGHPVEPSDISQADKEAT